ncbi:flagellar biosynthesis protein FlhB [Mesorhizobium sp. M4B.F.Ca.ET.215.01.1.1]|uniref:flagellar biosynthesis protein FlhB n=1 Tax=unclassified Mesorhizobium TaxID=325217 RepID=UPI000FCAEFAE|nr:MULTISPECIES: flagellar biosynthesis protein FlhB [unclassified Mesorhizobium]RUW27941.1 flagellar biosynthesis protein FlhB [Mesorhizobium sp. M4B.F.Ca.ET.013.02.1.1]RVD40306.1 flagellar biosynthesis protein FlhB [Mesorhizobium sp. M4B.F.Ca.ET.019.03.1.1]TGQ14013.1 flagellar biosynthesis protein FlhB [Mesorhizobium sp. M4B.F.Ca.ET.215.01.1.1]TGQ47209.1 flagellar biosynthesis protein FlhB [Mesorhizobium sp. M00.F.Ca.ET.220.01.1.1]TGR07580.1 flagellar biosynthesis protein FlhB [Mesorhizobium
MAEAVDKDSKTEEATEKKIRDTVEQGKLPHSREAAIFTSFVAILVFTVFYAKDAIVDLGMFLSMFLEKPEAWPMDTENDVIALYQSVIFEIGRAVVSLLVLLVVAGVGASVFQNMPQFVGDRIRPQLSRISITKGWSRMFGVQGFVEFLKSLGKLGFAVVVLGFTLSEDHRRLLAGMITNPVAFGLVIRSIAVDILVAIVFVMGLIAAVDLVWSRFNWRRDLRMSKQEVKDEMKQSEGDPIVKSRLRSLARDRARRRMMTAVPRATLIIANPTHFSIALKYVREEDSAPLVLAKGQDLVALKIREIAREHNIPIFEDVALARSMYTQVSVDSVIPSQFYQAVAELVRIVYSKKAERRLTS